MLLFLSAEPQGDWDQVIVPAAKKESIPRITIQPATQANSKLPLRLPMGSWWGAEMSNRKYRKWQEGGGFSEEIDTRNGSRIVTGKQ